MTRSGVPAGWKDVLSVYLHSHGRVVPLGGLRVTQKESSFDFTLPGSVFRMKPAKISLNYNEDVLAKIKQ